MAFAWSYIVQYSTCTPEKRYNFSLFGNTPSKIRGWQHSVIRCPYFIFLLTFMPIVHIQHPPFPAKRNPRLWADQSPNQSPDPERWAGPQSAPDLHAAAGRTSCCSPSPWILSPWRKRGIKNTERPILSAAMGWISWHGTIWTFI